MKKLTDKIKLIISAVLLAVFAGVVVIAVIVIDKDITNSVPNVVKLLLFFGGAIGVLFFFILTAKLAIGVAKERARVKRLIAAGVIKVQNPREDVIRKPVKYGDEKGFKELEEHTLKFLENIVYPQGFIDFLKKYTEKGGEDLEKAEPEPLTRYVERGGEYYEIADFYSPDKLIEINKNVLLYSDDYHTQFRDIILFADDESGHCYFLLDYGKGGEPTVKFLDDELDIVWKLADNFSEFAGKVKECTFEQFYAIVHEYEKNKLKK